ncbi:flippase [Salinigranum halophilum]|uniref:flippase n=1 Tax=Salinigranum halophilum TaxID=2565931 RepID=UPI0010A8436D|nr:flippase [Salinigranum halophilum]
MNLARSSLKLFAANVTSAGVQFLGITLFARELGASQMGVFFLFQALLGMLAVPADFGIRGAVEKRISEGEARGVFLSSALALKSAPLVVIVGGILLLGPFINDYVGAEVAVLLAGAIILQELAQLSVVVLKGELRVGETAVLRVAQQVTWVGGGLLLIRYGLRAEAMIYSLLAGLGVMMAWGWYKSSVSLGRPSVERARSLFDYSKYNVVSSVGGYFYSWMDVAIIGLFLTQADVGAYEVAWRVAAVTILFSRAISATMFPQISAWDSSGVQENIERVLPKLITPSLLLVIPAFFGTLLYSNEILGFVFGGEYTIAAIPLMILMLDKITEAVQVVFGRALQAVNRPDLAARATTVGVLLNLVLNFLLIRQFGLIGAAVATTVASLVGGVVLHGYYLSQIIELRVPYNEIASSVVAAVAMLVVLLLLNQEILAVNRLSDLMISITSGAIVYALFVVLAPPLQPLIKGHYRNLIS